MARPAHYRSRMQSNGDWADQVAQSGLAKFGVFGRIAQSISNDRRAAETLEARVSLLEQQLDQVLAILAGEYDEDGDAGDGG